MENVMTNGVCQLNEQEMIETEGGGITYLQAFFDFIYGASDSWAKADRMASEYTNKYVNNLSELPTGVADNINLYQTKPRG